MNEKNKEFEIFLSINYNKINALKDQAKSKGYKTFGEIKKYIGNYYKNMGIIFEPSILILCCNNYKEYKKLYSGSKNVV